MWLYDTGHGKIETMGALTISSLLLVTGGGIAWHAAETLQAWRGCPLRLNCQDLSVEIYSAGYVVVIGHYHDPNDLVVCRFIQMIADSLWALPFAICVHVPFLLNLLGKPL